MITTQNTDFEVLGRLGRGQRATTELAAAMPASGVDGLVVLKRLRGAVSATSAFDEIAAVRAAASPHVVALLDVVSWQGETTLVLRALAGGSLHDRLAAGDVLRGEAVTLAVPLIDAWIALRGAHVVHDGIDADAVLFDSEGTAVLGGFGAARVIPADDLDSRQNREAAARDDHAMVALVLAILRGIAPSTARDVQLGQWISTRVASFAPLPVTMIAEIRDRLFEMAEPLPVRLLHLEDGVGRGRAALPGVDEPENRHRERRGEGLATHRRLSEQSHSRSGVPVETPDEETRDAWTTIIGSVRQVRARVWVLGLGSVAAVVAAFFLL